MLACGVAQAGDLIPQTPRWSGRFNIVFENDALKPGPTDSWYTHGSLLSYLSAPLAPGRLDRLFLPGASGEMTRRFEVVLGQSIFTPESTKVFPPDPNDRPYAGWLYTGIGVFQETNRNTLDHIELLVGVIGPASLAKEVQSNFHSSLGQNSAAGWAFQLKNEPGIVLSYERKWRVDLVSGAGIDVDVIPQLGATVGNIFTYAQVGGMLRVGHNMKGDYGPLRIRPAMSGSAWFDQSQVTSPVGWYLYAGTQVRAVARDIFLDGNTFASSAHVQKIPIVVDLVTGASMFWLNATKLDVVLAWRTKEFVNQSRIHGYGGFNLSFAVP